MYTTKTLLLVPLALFTTTVVFANRIIDESLFTVPTQLQFENFKSAHGRVYDSVEEEVKRFNIFTENLAYIQEQNLRYAKGEIDYFAGINQFSDMTNEEYNAWVGPLVEAVKSPNAEPHIADPEATLPAEVDWVKGGLVTPVKDQKQCGSCWSFSATGALEGQWKKHKGQMVSLSEQNLVDCSRSVGNQGCNGGWPFRAYDWIKSNGGIDTEQSYPYEAKDDKCRYNAANKGASVTGHKEPAANENGLQDAVANIGPISICIDASHISFQTYTGGIYSEPRCSSSRLDHAVLAVGYGTDGGKAYWLVKNSWNTTWGDKGYVRIARNANNMCGVATQATYPLV